MERQGLVGLFYGQTQDKKTLKRINSLLTSIERSAGNPQGQDMLIGKAERLKYSQEGLLSVRVDKANRLVYKIESSNVLFVISCRGHYR